MADNIQKIELNTFYEAPVHCPFCGVRPVSDEQVVTPCPHTLFVAHDEGFEYRSDRFNENLHLTGLTDDEVREMVDETEYGFDGFTGRVVLPDAIKVAAYVGAPSGFGSYIGFAPLEA
jgi:hypothetical protein